MNLIVAIHGNPGSPADFEILTRALDLPDTEVVPHERPATGGSLSTLIAQLERLVAEHTPETLTLLGYSWGCWLAMQMALRARRKPDHLVLLNPYLVVERPLSVLAPIVLGFPLVGSWVTGRSMSKWTDEVIANCFRPESPPAELAATLRARYTRSDLWKGAARYKRLQQANPLPALDAAPCDMLVIHGSVDAVSAWSHQSAPLERLDSQIRVVEIENAGHSLLWTHTETVAREIAESLRAS